MYEVNIHYRVGSMASKAKVAEDDPQPFWWKGNQRVPNRLFLAEFRGSRKGKKGSDSQLRENVPHEWFHRVFF